MLRTVNLTCQMEKFPNSLDIFHIWKRVKTFGKGRTVQGKHQSWLDKSSVCQNKTGPIRFCKCQLSKLVTVWGILLVPIYAELYDWINTETKDVAAAEVKGDVHTESIWWWMSIHLCFGFRALQKNFSFKKKNRLHTSLSLEIQYITVYLLRSNGRLYSLSQVFRCSN